MFTFSALRYYCQSIYSLLTNFEKPLEIIRIFSGLPKKNTQLFKVCLKEHGLTFYMRHAMDIWSIKETFLDDFYHFGNGDSLDRGTIIDIGAGIGEFAIRAASGLPHCTIYGFEPFPQSFDIFQRNVTINHLENVIPLEAAISSLPGKLALDTSSGNPLQFRTLTDLSSSISVKTEVLMEFLAEHSIDSVDLLKLDCEGGEFDILLPLTHREINKFKRIVMEYHDSLTPHHHTELVIKLEEAGFRVEITPNVVHQDIGYIYAQLKENSLPV